MNLKADRHPFNYSYDAVNREIQKLLSALWSRVRKNSRMPNDTSQL